MDVTRVTRGALCTTRTARRAKGQCGAGERPHQEGSNEALKDEAASVRCSTDLSAWGCNEIWRAG